MGETTDQLRQEVDRKRDDAAVKIDQIEQRVTDTVQRVQEGVSDTTEQVRATVQETIQGTQDAVGQTAQQVTEQVKATTQQVAEQVKSSVDWRRQVEERPLVMLGAAFLGGFVLGSLTGGGEDDERARGHRAPDLPGYSYGGPLYGSQASQGHPGAAYGMRSASAGFRQQGPGGGPGSGLRGMIQSSGLQDTLTNASAALLGSFGERLRSTLEQQVPGFAEQMRQRTEHGQSGQEQSGGSGQAGRSSQMGGSRQMDQATSTSGQAATSDAAGRTAPYFGGSESGQPAGASSA